MTTGSASRGITLFLCGDVMTGRGIDQILPHPSVPHLYEPHIDSAADYVRLAEARTGPVPRDAGFDYVWGDALAELEQMRPDVRIVNLETAVTTCEEAWPGKGIHYRMQPRNAPCLAAAAIDCCVLANNHVLDWGYAGLAETLDTLRAAGIQTAGAGRDVREARAPAAVAVTKGERVLVFAYGVASAGIPSRWAATADRAGVSYLDDLSDATIAAIGRDVAAAKQPGDLTIASIHWGGNWGYDVANVERTFAQRLIDAAGIDLVHGHSSHHPKGMEVHADKLILYGCGDFLNDYEGITGYEAFRSNLTAMYFPTLDRANGQLVALTITPLAIRHLRLNRTTADDADWLRTRLDTEARRYGASIVDAPAGRFTLQWQR